MRVVGGVFFVVFTLLAFIGWCTIILGNHNIEIPILFNCLQVFFGAIWIFGDELDEVFEDIFYVSCKDAGTVQTGFDDKPFHPCVVGKDTVDFYYVWPTDQSAMWVAKFRNSTSITSLEYQQGKTHESVIVINDCKKPNKIVIKGSILSENDSIVVIKKN